MAARERLGAHGLAEESVVEDRGDILAMLAGGDRRSIGRVPEVVALVLAAPERLADLIAGMLHDDPVVAMRAADAAEKVTAAHPAWIAAHTAQLLGPIAACRQPEVRWHVAQLLPRLPLTDAERAQAAAVLVGFLADRSAIVRTFALDALAQFARDDAGLRGQVLPLLRDAAQHGSPAVRSRARKLLAALE